MPLLPDISYYNTINDMKGITHKSCNWYNKYNFITKHIERQLTLTTALSHSNKNSTYYVQ